MNDMTKVIEPKSDQMNADDLLTGPRTIKIRDVTIRPGTEQPVSIFFEGDNNKPWKCCKSMARVLVAAWGPDAKKYIGRSATLYCDPKVKWGGMEVGGIRISHLSHIDRDMLLALTATKGKKAPFVVKPMPSSPKRVTADPLAGQSAADMASRVVGMQPITTAQAPEAAPSSAPQPPVANPPSGGAPSPTQATPLSLPFHHGNVTRECTNRPQFLAMMEAALLSGTDADDLLLMWDQNAQTMGDVQAKAMEWVEKAKPKDKAAAQAMFDRCKAIYDQVHALMKAQTGEI